MNDMTLTARLRMEAEQAKAELRKTTGEVKKLANEGLKPAEAAAKKTGAAVDRMGKESAGAAGQVRGLGGAADTAEAGVEGLSAAQRRNQAAATGMADANRRATGSVGNLFAQFNDVGVMMAAGQNPLQLALQQGTQITQVIGPMGAAGAVKALGQAFLSLFSPVNLITIGTIAAGAAMFQWLTGSADAAQTAEDALAGMEAAVDKYREAVAAARVPTSELRREFGEMAAEARAELELAVDIERRNALRAAAEVAAAVTDGIRTVNTEFGDQRNLAQTFDLSLFGLDASARRERQALVNEVLAAYRQLDQMGTESLEGQIDAFDRALEAFRAAAEYDGNISTIEDEKLGQLSEQLQLLRQIKVEEEGTVNAAYTQEEFRMQALVGLNQRRVELHREVAEAEARAESSQAAATAAAAQAAERDTARAEEMLAAMQDQAVIQAAIINHGEDSVQVAVAREAAEARVFERMVDGLNVTDELKAELMEAFRVEQLMAGMDFAAPIDNATAAARALADQLGISLRMAMLVSAAGSQGFAGPDAVISNQYETGQLGGELVGVVASLSVGPNTRRDSVRSGGGGSRRSGRSRIDPDSMAGIQERAREALAELDITVAGIQERVRVGLLSTQDAAEEVDSATRSTAEGLADLIPELERAAEAAGVDGTEAVARWREELDGLVADLTVAGAELSETLSEGFKGPFTDWIAGTASAKDAFDDFADFVKRKAAEMIADRFTSSFITPFFDSILGGLGTNAVVPNALGGVPDAPGLAGHSNSVVNRPTFFGMGDGRTGLMGEAGPEAILPLLRGPGGLGVRAMGPDGREGVLSLRRMMGGALGVVAPFAKGGVVGPKRPQIMGGPGFFNLNEGSFLAAGAASAAPSTASGDVTVNVTNTAAGTRETVTERDEGGTRVIDVLIERVEAQIAGNIARGRGPIGTAMTNAYGVQRRPR